MESPRPARAPRILFVDDDFDLVTLFEGYCKDWGFDCEVVIDSRDALETAVRTRPDVIFLDVMMPVLDGFAVLKLLKADERVSAIPVIMLTGGAIGVGDKVRGLGGGAIDYLIKPIDPEEMLARIQVHLKLRKHIQDRELQVVRQTSVFLNHSINNLLATIQVAAELAADSNDEDERMRAQLIAESCQSIAEIVQKLKKIRRVISSNYVGTEEILDLDSSIHESGDEPPAGPQTAS